jgi:hypothetical protein
VSGGLAADSRACMQESGMTRQQNVIRAIVSAACETGELSQQALALQMQEINLLSDTEGPLLAGLEPTPEDVTAEATEEV